jgi:hypothetical protein
MAFNGTGSNVTSLNANNITSGTVPTARLGSGTANSSTFLRGDQTYASVAGAPNPLHGVQVFTSTGTFNVPTGVTAVKVTVIGAGGNGGAGNGNGPTGGGGGAGGYIIDYVGVTAGGTASVTVGTNAGSRASSFAGASTITAAGGTNGTNADAENNGAVGSSGASTFFGRTTYLPLVRRSFIAADSNTGLTLTQISVGGALIAAGQCYFSGIGAAGSTATNTETRSGIGAGAGGAGGSSAQQTGGTGTNGLVIVEW